MNLTLRMIKGVSLTYDELDNNFLYLNNKIDLNFTSLKEYTDSKIFSGPTGPAGLNGLNGLDGKDGKDGLDGLDGKDGLNGLDGKDGKDGTISDFYIENLKRRIIKELKEYIEAEKVIFRYTCNKREPVYQPFIAKNQSYFSDLFGHAMPGTGGCLPSYSRDVKPKAPIYKVIDIPQIENKEVKLIFKEPKRKLSEAEKKIQKLIKFNKNNPPQMLKVIG
jgi:hypothetical protein